MFAENSFFSFLHSASTGAFPSTGWTCPTVRVVVSSDPRGTVAAALGADLPTALPMASKFGTVEMVVMAVQLPTHEVSAGNSFT